MARKRIHFYVGIFSLNGLKSFVGTVSFLDILANVFKD